MTELFLLLLCLVADGTFGDRSDSTVVTVEEGSDAVLPCSLSTEENVESAIFDWSKDEGKKEVFRYEEGLHDNNGLSGQDEQFKGRVSHFPEELKTGNASIVIRNVEANDGGDYSCEFIQRKEKRIVRLQVVVLTTTPDIKILSVTEDGVLLQCEVRGAFPVPDLKWQDGSGLFMTTEEPQVTESRGRYEVLLQNTVTKTDNYRCEATQKEINHRTHAEIHVYIRGTEKEQQLLAIAVTLGIIFGLLVIICCCLCCRFRF